MLWKDNGTTQHVLQYKASLDKRYMHDANNQVYKYEEDD